MFSGARHFIGQNANGWDTAWISSFGGPNVDYGCDLKETPDKGFIIAGTTSSFGNGNTSFYIIKTDSLGKFVWSKAIGSSNNDVASSVELANDSVYFFGGFSNENITTGYDGYLVKTNSHGKVLWTKRYGGNDWDFFYGSCTMPDGGLVLCGETFSGTQGGSDALLVRVTADGDTLWTKKFGAKGNDAFYCVEHNGGRIYAAGKQQSNVTPKYNATVYKTDFNGTLLCFDVFTGNTYENVIYNDLYLTNTGKLLLAGIRRSDTSEHVVLRKTDTTAFTEVYYMTHNQKTYFNSVVEGPGGDMFVTGPARGGIAGGLNALCLRYDSVFTQLNYCFFGGPNDEEAFEMIRTSKGMAFTGRTTTYGTPNTESVYLVILTKPGLDSNYYALPRVYYDELSPVNLNYNQEEGVRLRCYPVPALNVMDVELYGPPQEGIYEISVQDILGKIVLSAETLGNVKTRLDVIPNTNNI